MILLNENRGVSLITLVITVVVMLIISTVVVSLVTNNNGLITNTNNAELQKNKSEEKEAVEWSAAQSVAVSDIGKVTSGNLEHYMDTYIGEDPEGIMKHEIEGYNDIFIVEFKVSGNKYTVDQDGMVYEGEQLNRDGIELPESLIINVGETIKLQYTSESSNVTWSNSNQEIAELQDDGTVTGKQNGHTVITVTTDKNKVARCFLTVQTEPTEVKIEPTEYLIDLTNENRTVELKATILPETANVYTNLTWTSSDTNVATVSDEGFVIGVGNGTATITAITENGITGTSTITVQTSATGMNLNASFVTLDRSETPEIQLSVVSFIPENANVGTNITWTSSDTTIATVDETGFVKGIKNGTAVITATTDTGITAQCQIQVITTIKSISVTPNNLTLPVGKTSTIVANITPNDGTATEDVVWSTSDSKVATITTSGTNKTNCTVSIVGKGQVTITAKTSKGYSSTCTITSYIPITNISVSPTSQTIYIGNGSNATAVQLTASVSPTNTDEKVTWTSSNSNVAKVSNTGYVTAVSTGTVTITVKNPDGTIKATSTITVKGQYKVSYNANGGSGAPGAQTKAQGVDLKLSSTKPSRSNYTFQGWATSSSGSVKYQPQGTYKTDADVTLYAVWKKKSTSGGGSSSGGGGRRW